MAEKSDAESFLERIVDLEYEIKKLYLQLKQSLKSSRYTPETVESIKKMIDFKKQRIAQLEKDLLILIKNKHD